jgi:hypothetical protein
VEENDCDAFDLECCSMNLQTRALAAILLTATAEALPLPAAPQLAALQLSQIPASKGPEKALVLAATKEPLLQEVEASVLAFVGPLQMTGLLVASTLTHTSSLLLRLFTLVTPISFISLVGAPSSVIAGF